MSQDLQRIRVSQVARLIASLKNEAHCVRRHCADLRSPFVDWIQVEITTHCNASCDYCPRTAYRDVWPAQHMSLATFCRLKPAFRRSNLVYLQGWGEPLLHPQFDEMVSIAKKMGCTVGATSNGSLWDLGLCERVVQLGLGIVAFSLAGTSDRQDETRAGTRIEDVLRSIRMLDSVKKKLGSQKPAIHVAYMALRSNFQELGSLPSLLAGLGVKQVVLSTLDFVPAAQLLSETIQPKDELEERLFRSQLEEAVEQGKKRGIEVHFRLASSGKQQGVCTENVVHAAFVSAHGDVCPCPYASLPIVPQGNPLSLPNRDRTHRLAFGNVNEHSFSTIWNSRSYRAFRRQHQSGTYPAPCLECPKLIMG